MLLVSYVQPPVFVTIITAITNNDEDNDHDRDDDDDEVVFRKPTSLGRKIDSQALFPV